MRRVRAPPARRSPTSQGPTPTPFAHGPSFCPHGRSAYTVYVLNVQGDGRRWLVFRRYREWHKLHEKLSAHFQNVPAIPPKTLFSLFGSMSPSVIEERSRGLQIFLEACMAHVEIRGSELFAAFLAEEGELKGLVQADELRELVRAKASPAPSGCTRPEPLRCCAALHVVLAACGASKPKTRPAAADRSAWKAKALCRAVPDRPVGKVARHRGAWRQSFDAQLA